VACVVFLAHVGLAQAQQAGQFPFALTHEGQMLGAVQGEVASFRGLAYAAAPTGPLRWRAPQELPASSDMRTAYDFGPECLQPGTLNASEDCLTVNVFRPFGVDGPLPVMIFIHGGDFVAGTANDPAFDGAKLAQGGVMVVTVNYRLGAFGWFASHGLDATQAASGNFGLMDQIAALRWVHDNAAAFGGDPHNVTLFGSGAGAISVALLMLCPDTTGFFQKAILQSAPARRPLHSLGEARAAGDQLINVIAPGSQHHDARETSAKLLLAAEVLLRDHEEFSFGPMLDGDLVREDVVAGFKAHHQQRIPMIVGSNRNETKTGEERDLGLELRQAGYSREEVDRSYPDNSNTPNLLAAHLYTDRVFTEPARYIARLHSSTGAPTFRYRFNSPTEAQIANGEGGHGQELQFIFGNEGAPGATPFARSDRDRANVLRSYWINFARSGDPNGPGLPIWQPSSQREQLLEVSREGIESVDDALSRQLDHLERAARTGD
jgi:para-nitrobenzyl esterase